MAPDRRTRFELAQWMVPKAPKARFNLGTSEVQGRTTGDHLPPKDMKIGSGIFDGDRELRALIADRYGLGTRNVALTAGASEANFLVYLAVLQDGGSALVENPVYPPLLGIPDLLRFKVVRWERRFEDGFCVDLESLKRIMGESDVRLIVLTNLHNPTGTSISPEDMRAVADIAADHGATVVCDEIYREFVAETTVPAVSCGDHCITTASVSKVHGFGGLRLGWTVASEEMTKRILTVREMASVCCSRLDEEMGKSILRDKGILEEARAVSKHNLAIVKGWIEATDRVSWVEPDGGIVCFPRIDGIRSSLDFAQHLFDDHGTLVSPGIFFGAEGHVRIGCGGKQEVLKGGLEMIAKALEGHRA